MLVLGLWKSDSVCMYVYTHTVSDSFPIYVITEYWVEFHVLYVGLLDYLFYT